MNFTPSDIPLQVNVFEKGMRLDGLGNLSFSTSPCLKRYQFSSRMVVQVAPTSFRCLQFGQDAGSVSHHLFAVGRAQRPAR